MLVFRLIRGEVLVNWLPPPRNKGDEEATKERARAGKSVHSKSLSPSHHITLHSFSSDRKQVSVWTFHMLPLLLMADDSSTLEAEGLAI